MVGILKESRWVLVLRGISAIILALFLLFSPGLTLATGALSFAILFGIFALFDGFSIIYSAVVHREGQWVWWLLLGIIGVLAGFGALGNPFLFGTFTLLFMIYLIAFRSIFGGFLEMFMAWELRKEIEHEWLLAISGIFSVIFGFIILSRPIVGIEVLILLTSFYMFFAGVLQIALSFQVGNWAKTVEKTLAR